MNMSYKALYRKYRPNTFEEVSGQEYIVKILKNALISNKIGHAYLFAGPRGTGKTTMAKLFAKALNCEEGIGHTCGHCKNCLAILEGNHPDVIEIDAASNNGVEEVRDLIDKVRYSTILGRYKVYIIDEVHMMTPGAFNALLKTLEEPPAHVIFILATTEPHKILPTILSRCQRFDFSKLSDKEIKQRLVYVLNNEHIEYEEKAIDLIISLCDGGMRDALSILDQVLAYSQNKLNSQDILNIFSLESVDEKVALLQDAANHDTSNVLNRIQKYQDKGSDIKRLTNDLLLMLKDALIYKRTGSTQYLELLNGDQVKKLASIYSINNLINSIDIVLNAIKDFKNVSSISPIFSIALLKICSLENNNITKDEIQIETKDQQMDKSRIRPPFIKSTPIDKTIDSKQQSNNENTQAETIKEKEKNETRKPKEIQPSIFDESFYQNVKIDSKLTRPIDAKIEENLYVLSKDLILNVMISATKDMKTKLIKDWDDLQKLSMHPQLGGKAALLYDAHLLVATKTIMLIEYDLTSKVDKINVQDAQMDLQKITQMVFKRKMFVYALSRNESVELQQKFINLKQIGKLPKPDTIEITMIGE